MYAIHETIHEKRVAHVCIDPTEREKENTVRACPVPRLYLSSGTYGIREPPIRTLSDWGAAAPMLNAGVRIYVQNTSSHAPFYCG